MCDIIFHALVALKLLVSLISRLVACNARIVVDRQTDTQTNYCNPRCACAPRVNYTSASSNTMSVPCNTVLWLTGPCYHAAPVLICDFEYCKSFLFSLVVFICATCASYFSHSVFFILYILLYITDGQHWATEVNPGIHVYCLGQWRSFIYIKTTVRDY